MSDIEPAATVTTSSLATALAAAVPFASRDVTLPAVCAVQLHCGSGVLTATATDRYTIGHARQEATGNLTRPWILHRCDARALRKAISQHMADKRHGTDLATLTEHDDNLVVRFGNTTLLLTEPEGASSAPDLGAILGKLPTGDGLNLTVPIGLSRRVLRPLLKVAKWAPLDPMRWTIAEPGKPIRVEIGDWFVAAVMPVSLRGDEKNVSVEMPATAKAEAVTQ
ncbi:hypothetical protein [Verrucosispora sp. NA02020]|uniref:hypothetical protein n=1 Tax=Verrucosispora sp. NA02020 TaxID=2742132 RepID=UPI003D717733